MPRKDETTNGDTWADELRSAVSASPLTHYAICQAAGIERSMLARFMQGAGISLATAEKIGLVVGVALTGSKRRTRKG